MLTYLKSYNFFYSHLLSEQTRRKGETIMVYISIAGFIIHLSLIALMDLNILKLNDTSKFLSNPIAAIYTPFSFILIYEVYLLVYYLPRSTSTYIGKQYEIITLIVIRRVFKHLSKLEFTSDWFKVKEDLQFTYDLLATVVLFYLIYIFYNLNRKRETETKRDESVIKDIAEFRKIKTILAMALVPIFLVMSVYSFSHWVIESFFSLSELFYNIKDVNKVFFDEFFTVLILVDVLLLLISFLYTDKFNKVIRNSGFIVSTILIKLSFGIDGLLNTILIVMAVLFGIAILYIHNLYEKIDTVKIHSVEATD